MRRAAWIQISFYFRLCFPTHHGLRASISKDELVERKLSFLLTLSCVCCCHLVLKWEKRAARLVVTENISFLQQCSSELHAPWLSASSLHHHHHHHRANESYVNEHHCCGGICARCDLLLSSLLFCSVVSVWETSATQLFIKHTEAES